MALVPAARTLVPPSDSLVPYGQSAVGEPLDQKLARLRGDREAHSRKQIWTKDPHGGPYRKVDPNKGYDPLTHLPDRSERKAELGYERVKTGPTSNFVGNHMTQGAIDLVQAQLEAPPAAAAPPLLLGAAAAAAAASAQQQPRLLRTGQAADLPAASAAAAVPLQQYSWADAGAAARVEVPVAQMKLGGRPAEVTCQVQPDRLDILVVPAASGEDSNCGSGGSCSRDSAGPAAAAAARLHLRLHPLHAPVVPERSRCYVKGLPALPPCSSGTCSGNASSAGGSRGQVQQRGVPGAGQDQQAEQARHELSIKFPLPPGAESVVVQLAKADPQQQWEALQASPALPLARGSSGNGSGGQPDLTSLRKTVRQKLGRAPAAAAAAPPASDDRSLCPAKAGTAAVPAAAAAACSASMRGAWQDALQQAEALVAAGQHAQALECTAACAAALAAEHEAGPGPGPEPQLAVRVHALRAHCHTQLGRLKQAVEEYSAAIQVLQRQGQGQEAEQQGEQGRAQAALCQLLLARSSVWEQQEQLEAALADAEQAAGMIQQPLPTTVLLAMQRLRRACRRR